MAKSKTAKPKELFLEITTRYFATSTYHENSTKPCWVGEVEFRCHFRGPIDANLEASMVINNTPRLFSYVTNKWFTTAEEAYEAAKNLPLPELVIGKMPRNTGK
jgi:hypothetical protein